MPVRLQCQVADRLRHEQFLLRPVVYIFEQKLVGSVRMCVGGRKKKTVMEIVVEAMNP